MSYPPYCIVCNSGGSNINSKNTKNHLCWHGDFSGEDYGIDETECIIGVYSCMHKDCGVTYEIIDFISEDEENQRVVKYYRNYDEDRDIIKENMISSCIYCSSKLVEQDKWTSKNNQNTIFGCEGLTTELQCPNCETRYEVVDELDAECDDLEVYESRTIFLK